MTVLYILKARRAILQILLREGGASTADSSPPLSEAVNVGPVEGTAER